MSDLSLWGGAADPRCLLDALLETAREQPDAIAVVDGDRTVSYAELVGWARDIAALLAGHGVTAEDRVGVTGPRGAEVVAAMLGTAALGAVYVPLDPEYPVRRLAHMLSDSGAAVLLHTGTVPALESTAVRVPIPGPEGSRPYRAGDAWRPVECRPDLPFYVIYTSGSTGWPKGVAIPHSCLDNMAEWQAAHSPRPDLRTAQFAPLNFDVSFQEVLGSLRGGGTVVIVPERLRREPVQLLAWLIEHRIERLFLPYVALQMLAVAVGAAADVTGLRLREVNTAGEQVVCTQQIRAMFERLPGARLVNHYGQSESAMVTSHILPAAVGDWPTLPPIGVPLPGCELLVDPAGQDEPGVGELLVAGLPVSLGYLNRPELNEERFRTVDPTPQGHTRVFRTGDLVRIRDGVVQFLNRLDSDVKIRGIRVNLLEVDVQLLGRPGVDGAACVVVESASGVRSLRAAVTASADGPEPDLPAALAHLRDVLPDVSVPLSLTVLPELPRTPSGKTDRDAVARLITEDIRRRRAAGAAGRPGGSAT
ncbi:AMP-binding protein [Kitasatospora sp. NBC_01560]|uniref:AMP-binding protein n=1 Tax=Kitasatospora sp. NBC_01560 TaxID=2975965 RepID=UPI00386340E2